ncbi:class I adenylate-forming enzyme family protein [Aliikangiella sp. IMCC44359]|uniref:class I adenylate-forming enzyme family protein n=1 Tax=Aliikangiella sp. IMCC44359 TaxID=3459125 RepID=UPI00403AF1A1
MQSNHSDLVDDFLADASVGAGNFIRKIHEYMDDDQRHKALVRVDQPLDKNKYKDKLDFSLQDIIDISNIYAANFYNMGVKPKDPVVLFFDDNIHYFFQYVALTKIGAIPVFVNSLLNVDIFIKFAIKVEAKFLVSTYMRILSVKSLFEAEKFPINMIDIEKASVINNNVEPPPIYRHGSNDVVLIAHTSGTTGIPKAVQFTHEALCYGIKQEVKKLPVNRVLSILPHSHGAALSILMSSLLRGASVRIQTQKDSLSVLDTIEKYQPDFIASFPKIFVDLCRENLNKFDMSSIKYWLSTGDANHEAHIRQLISQGHHVRNGERIKGSCFIDNLGSSEFAFAIFRNIHTVYSNNYDRYIGVPFDWIEAVVLNDDGEELPVNEVGYLGVMSKSVTKGYWNNSYLTEKNTLSGYWLTGDLVYKNEQGIFFHVDRVTDYINTVDGVLYSCQSEEFILSRMPEIFEVSIVGGKNSNSTEVVALIEMARGSAFNENILKEKINKLFAERGWPKISSVMEQSANQSVGVTGKKLKRKLRTAHIPAKDIA